MTNKLKSISLLALACLIWGAGFAGTKWTLDDYSPVWSNSFRFLFAGLIAFIFSLNKLKKLFTFGPFICGLILMIGLQLQTYGIAYTTLAKSGFLTTFYAIFTPIISIVLYKKSFSWHYWALVFLALLGIAFLCELKLENFNVGDMFILASAVFFSFHILAIGKYANSYSAIELNFFQIVYMGIFGIIYGVLTEGFPSMVPIFTPGFTALGFIILVIFSSLLAFSIQVEAQKGIAPHIASIVFLLESVFSAFFGWLFFGEMLSALAIFGCTLVVVSVALIPLSQKKGV